MQLNQRHIVPFGGLGPLEGGGHPLHPLPASWSRLRACGSNGRMPTTPETEAFDRGVQPVLQIVLPGKANAVVSFRADPLLQARIDQLAWKSTEGQLTETERAEYVGYVRANKFVAILQRQARRMVHSDS